MKCVINNELVLSRAPEGPLAAYIGAFAKSQSAQGMPWIRFTGKFCSLRVSAIGLSRRESHNATSAPIMLRGICEVALDRCGLARVMLLRSGTSLSFCAVRA